MSQLPTLGLLTTRMDGWYQSQIWHGVTAAAKILGVRVCAFVGSSLGDPNMRGGPEELFHLARGSGLDGYLAVTGTITNYVGIDPIRRLLASLPPRPTVSIGIQLDGVCSIVPDGGGMVPLARHILGVHGLRRVAFIGGPPTNIDANRRLADWRQVQAEFGIRPDPLLEEIGSFHPEGGRDAMVRLLSRHRTLPQAVVCANDAMAIGVYSVLASRGISIPQDMVVAGYDDIEESRSMVPPLTTVRPSTFDLAFRAVERLVRILGGEPASDETTETDLVVRRSCGCRPGSDTERLPRLLVDAAGIPDPEGIRHILSNQNSVEQFLLRMEKSLESCEQAEIDLWEENVLSAASGSFGPELSRALMSAHSLVSRAGHNLETRRRQSLQHLMRDQFAAVQSLTSDPSREGLPQRILEAMQPFADNHMRLLLFREDLEPISEPLFGIEPFRLEIDLRHRTAGPPSSESVVPRETPSPGTWATLSLSLGKEHYGVVQVRDWSSNELFLESLRHSLTLLLSNLRRTGRP